jgi:ubiquinone/menaquinone biosynthesis C-methylase UbiE
VSQAISLGQFDSLAEDYSRYRPSYAPAAVSALLGLVGKPLGEMDAVDVGAGTGIWTRLLAARGLRSVVALEPSDNMRAAGKRDSRSLPNIEWRAGSGEHTGLAEASADLVTMASSFHWVDFDAGIAEFCRVLRPDGWFAAVWNPRYIEGSPLLVEIEGWLTNLHPGLNRKSSGRSAFTETLTERLLSCGRFSEVLTFEGRHIARQTPEQYIGAWRSVNDVQAQLGPERFERFLAMVREKVAGLDAIETTYLTRGWAARRAG